MQNNGIGTAQPVQAAAGTAAAPTQPAPAAPGAVKEDYLGFMKELHDLLLLRIEAAGQQNPNYGMAIDKGVSPEAAQEIFIILPELKPIYDAIDAGEGNVGNAPIQTGQPQQSDNPVLSDTPGGVSRGLVG